MNSTAAVVLEYNSTPVHTKVLGMVVWMLAWSNTIIGQNDCQKEGNIDHIILCTPEVQSGSCCILHTHTLEIKEAWFVYVDYSPHAMCEVASAVWKVVQWLLVWAWKLQGQCVKQRKISNWIGWGEQKQTLRKFQWTRDMRRSGNNATQKKKKNLTQRQGKTFVMESWLDMTCCMLRSRTQTKSLVTLVPFMMSWILFGYYSCLHLPPVVLGTGSTTDQDASMTSLICMHMYCRWWGAKQSCMARRSWMCGWQFAVIASNDHYCHLADGALIAFYSGSCITVLLGNDPHASGGGCEASNTGSGGNTHLW